ncbi:lamin tail domain-containing protein [Gracilimonas sp. BCB1]|uniref:lamin tail domain-containing protein n=1 Tax=Gracilimonas sp. BCB1 TaxID=3152362 RepID=UPI0032D8BE30
MKNITKLLFTLSLLLSFSLGVLGQVRINEIRADDASSDDIEFIELIGVAGTDITDYQIYHVNGSGDSEIFTHTIGSFTIPDDGITDNDSNSLGFYVLGASSFSTGTDESTSGSLQNGPDGIILYNASGDVIDAVAWQGAGDISTDITTTGSSSADNYLHVTSDDDSGDNSLQAPDDVVGDDGSGWTLASATIGSLNDGQTSGSIVLESSVKSEPANHASSFSASGSINSVDLSWTDATGSPLPDAYLIRVSDVSFGSISSPSDATAVTDDSDLSDGSGALNVAIGEESASFTGLDETTTYYFKIFPYTNSGSDIDYKTDGTVPEDDATTLETPDIIFNEILADPDGSSGDANGDGIVDTDDDEFIELVNYGATDLDISNWVFSDNNTDRYTFPASTTLKPLQAAVIFGGGTPTGDFGNSFVDSTSSLGLNNSGETITLKNGSGIEIISLTYGSEANSDESITRNPDLTGSFAQHETADTKDASSFSPGTRIDGTYFQPSTVITGSAGWRLLSLPVEDGTVADISDNTAVQGVSGGDNSGSDPNFFYNPAFDGSDQSDYLVPTNTTTPWGDGLGFFLYFFDNSTAGSSPLPITLDAFGNAPDTDVQVTVSDTWTLAGNPYNSNLSIDDISGDDGGNGVNDGLMSPVYLYDSSGWVTVNLGSGYVIGDWSGFFVQRFSSSTTQLTMPTSAATTDTVKLSKLDTGTNFRQVDLLLEAPGGLSDQTNKLYFSDHSTSGKDGFDGGKLTPMNGSPYMAFENDFGNGKELLVQDARPLNPAEEMWYELVIGDNGISGTYTLTWPELKNIPEDWEFTLNDYETGESVIMAPGTSYTFEVEATQKQKKTKTFRVSTAQAKPEDVSSRFSIVLKTSTTTSTEQVDTPESFALRQNYPNPFNPNTTIEYSVSEPAPVILTVYNVMGQQVATLVNETKSVGTYRVSWNATDMASGIYHYRLQAGNQVLIRQMTLIK